MSWLKLLLQYLPIVLNGVVAVEAAIPTAPGTAKKQVILDAIQAGAGVAATAPTPVVAEVGTLIDTVVGSLNTSGVFVHASAAATKPTAAATKPAALA
jgi:hypothetical protein